MGVSVKVLVRMEKIRKEFPGVVALDDISFDLHEGEVHLLLGENGAGKSTLMKILAGVYVPTEGNIIFGESVFKKLTPKIARSHGVSVIFQELSVVNELSILENLFLGNLLTKKIAGVSVVDFISMEKKTKELLSLVGLKRSPKTLVDKLTISEKQLVEIAKALTANARVIVMDEPTSSLNIEEAENLFRIIRDLKKQNVGVVYISHKMEEMRKIGDRVTVLKDGKLVNTKPMSEIESDSQIVSMMVGRDVITSDKFRDKNYQESKEIVFQVDEINRKDGKARDVSFEVYKNEILGFYGLMGAGRTELMETIFTGKNYKSGSIYLNGEEVKIRSPYNSIKQGIAMVTENRRYSGIIPNFEIWENVALPQRLLKAHVGGVFGLISQGKELKKVTALQKNLKIKCSSLRQLISGLSGGNQQKAIVGKWLATDSKVIVFDEPTKGIDVGAKGEIYSIMRNLAKQGIAIIMVSSEMPELLAVCDRIAVYGQGEIKDFYTAEEATEEKIITSAIS